MVGLAKACPQLWHIPECKNVVNMDLAHAYKITSFTFHLNPTAFA